MKKKLTLDPTVEQMLKDYELERTDTVQDYLDHPERIPVFMDLKVDYAFKYILGHKPILLKLINDILPVNVSDIEYLPNEIPVISVKEKRAVFDVICTARKTGERFITEMQCVPDMDMDNRLLYYGCSLIHSQIERGKEDYSMKPVYVLCVANYKRNHGRCLNPEQFFFSYQLREQSDLSDRFSENLQFLFLELPSLKKVWDSLETNLERWCYLFGNLNNFAKIPDNPAGFDDVFNLARTGDLDDCELKKYVNSMLDRYTIYTTTEYARQEGYKKGLAIGKEEGMKEGMKEGEKLAMASVARKLLEMNTPIDSIVRVTGLSEDLIQAL